MQSKAGTPLLKPAKDRAVSTARVCRFEKKLTKRELGARLNVQTELTLFQMASTKRDWKERQHCFETEDYGWWNALE